MQSQSGEVAGSRVKIGYVVELHYDVAAPAEFLFQVHAARTPQQRVVAESFVVDPDVPVQVEDVSPLGNRLARLSAEPGALRVRYSGTVVVTHFMKPIEEVVATPLAELPSSTLRFLLPSRYCQVDRVQSLAWKEFGHLSPGFAQVTAVSEWVRARTRFQVGTSGTNTSALETLEQCVGVCRDFAHLTISLLRALNYPARIVTGVDYGAEPALGPPDFHAYAEVYMDGRWYLVDATGISPLTGLIRIATGRDAAEVSFATMFGPVSSGMPQVSFAAAEDAAHGIVLPRPTNLAVSTCEE